MTVLPVSDCQYSELHKNPGDPVCTTRMLEQGCPKDCELYQPVNREVVIVKRPDKPRQKFKPGTTVVQYGLRLAKHNDIFGNTVEDLWLYNFAGISGLWLQQLAWAELLRVAEIAGRLLWLPPKFLELIDMQLQLKGDFQ